MKICVQIETTSGLYLLDYRDWRMREGERERDRKNAELENEMKKKKLPRFWF